MSIHPSVVFHLSGVGSWGQQPKQRDPDFLLPNHLGHLVRGNPKAFPSQPRNIVPPACPGSSSGPPPSETCPEYLTGETSRRHPNQMPEPPQLAPLDVRSSGSPLSPSRMTELLILSLRESPDTLQRKLILATCIRDLLLSVMTQSS
ncbi:hypothetical protein AMECASPLE_021542 [Ameca splendens]|uniref:Uncharacterized protein n=1 Tax=Ameca splendens TaxID=208324 RepID=A0ABV0ZDF3_9TELE